jgi:hypothetical protein
MTPIQNCIGLLLQAFQAICNIFIGIKLGKFSDAGWAYKIVFPDFIGINIKLGKFSCAGWAYKIVFPDFIECF